jgi:type IV pilus assembly protein PilE
MVGKRTRGFTLIELMIVVVVVGILAGIALPAYQSQVRKSNRSAAQQFMQDVATKEQQIMMDRRSYGAVAATADFGNSPSATPPGVGLAAPSTTTGKYDFSVAVTTGPPPTFTITATALNGQTVDGNLTLNDLGAKTGNW